MARFLGIGQWAGLLVLAWGTSQIVQAAPMTDVNHSPLARGFQSQQELEQFLTVDDQSVVVRSVPVPTQGGYSITPGGNAAPPAGVPVATADLLANVLTNLGDLRAWALLGARLWNIVVDNRPVIDFQTQNVSIFPQALASWAQMETWKGPQAVSYQISAKNLYGVEVLSSTYTVSFNYGGSIQGKGQFLANVTIIPTAVDVGWGFRFNAQVAVGQTLNMGTAADPIPGIDLTLKYKFGSYLHESERQAVYYVRGDGAVWPVN